MITFYIKGKLEHASTFLSNLKVHLNYILFENLFRSTFLKNLCCMFHFSCLRLLKVLVVLRV